MISLRATTLNVADIQLLVRVYRYTDISKLCKIAVSKVLKNNILQENLDNLRNILIFAVSKTFSK